MVETDVTVGRFSNGRIRIEPSEVRAGNGTVYPFLIVPVELSFAKVGAVPGYAKREASGFVVLSMQAILSVGSGSARIADSIAIHDPLEFKNKYDVSRNYSLEFPLDPQRIKYLEASRRGNMSLGLRFQFLVSHYEPLVIQRDGQSEEHDFV